MASSNSTPHVAPVDGYKERPLSEALADPKDIAKVEARADKDQIEDYHQKHPTLKQGKAQKADPPVLIPGDPVE